EGAWRLHVAPVLRPGPAGRSRHLHLDVRRVQRGQPDRQDSGGRLDVSRGHLGDPVHAEPGRNVLLVRLLPASHPRRRKDAERTDTAHGGAAHQPPLAAMPLGPEPLTVISTLYAVSNSCLVTILVRKVKAAEESSFTAWTGRCYALCNRTLHRK